MGATPIGGLVMLMRTLSILSIMAAMVANAKASDKEIGASDQRREAIAACGSDAMHHFARTLRPMTR